MVNYLFILTMHIIKLLGGRKKGFMLSTFSNNSNYSISKMLETSINMFLYINVSTGF